MLDITLCGKTLKNPVIAASGTFGFGQEYSSFFDVSRLGGISSKGLTLHPRYGNSGRRIFETASGLINSIGLQNPGVEAFLSDELPRMRALGTAILANVGGGSIEEYVQGCALVDASSVDFIELNISCPNVKHGGMAFGIREDTAYEVVQKVRACVSNKPLIVKLSPNAQDIVRMAEACARAGADALSLVNTFQAMAVDWRARKPVFDNVTAGLSGPCIKPIALRMVYEVCRAVDIPVIGMGGIACAEDALEFICAGATCVQVGSANFTRPDAALRIIEKMETLLRQQGIAHVNELRGCIRA
nr:dihydroorotate dehydrogenase [Maliibacterium massiliense]